MGKGTLTIYSASAGSGKTYRLTAIYLTNIFRSRYNYRRILAVTFTHKATAEMKSRILDNLSKLAAGDDSDYLPELIADIKKPEEWIREEAKYILNSILHDFSRFSVSTIDSFFQKILRAFAKEAGLNSGFNIELDHSIILADAVDEMIASASKDPRLEDWLKTYVMTNIDEEKSWNLKDGIIKLAEELFREKYKILSENERSNLENKEFLLKYINKIRSVVSSFEKQLQIYGKEAETYFIKYQLTDDMFYRKGQGVPGYVKALAAGIVKEPNSYVRDTVKDPPRWSTGQITSQLQGAIASGLEKSLQELLRYHEANFVYYKSALVVLSNIYALGILSDVWRQVHLITTADNNFLLSDAGDVLSLITGKDQSPFIYEKVGNRFENFMIDEFQDTSIIQWSNFKPLIDNSMSEGFDNLVVGDVKQSIYRWRNSDWKILGEELYNLVDNDRFISIPLATNWRSSPNIIKFNNSLFSLIPGQLDDTLALDSPLDSFRKLYSEAVQDDPGRKTGGYVKVEFIENEKEEAWQDKVLQRLPSIIETIQSKGYKASDIGIIVRDGRDGARVLKALIDYGNSCSSEQRMLYNYSAVSNDSLLLSNSPAICFLIAVISVLDDPGDLISRASMLRYYLLSTDSDDTENVPLTGDKISEISGNYFPDGYEIFLDQARKMALFEAIEYSISFFGLGKYAFNVAYLNTFQDYIVSFSGNKNSGLSSFLEWWNNTGIMKSVVLPGNQEAIRILTIHKSKGLEFKVVILPFLNWHLDHMPSKQTILWVKPQSPPFDELGILPVKYGSELSNTIFKENYYDEKYSVYLDNLNLLYVALTRAKDALYGFSVENPRSENSISVVLKNAFISDKKTGGGSMLNLHSYYNSETYVFEYGEIPENKREESANPGLKLDHYKVTQPSESLKLKLHGENYFSSEEPEVRKKINYGKLMHEVFEGINIPADISAAVRKLVLEGKLPENESYEIENRINSLISSPQVAEWFMQGNEVLTEAGILLPSGTTRRPDRVILRNGKATIIDFKFGEENDHYLKQVDQYRSLLGDMGYNNVDAFLWYVDKHKIVSV